jgi:hypothetical protein
VPLLQAPAAPFPPLVSAAASFPLVSAVAPRCQTPSWPLPLHAQVLGNHYTPEKLSEPLNQPLPRWSVGATPPPRSPFGELMRQVSLVPIFMSRCPPNTLLDVQDSPEKLCPSLSITVTAPLHHRW